VRNNVANNPSSLVSTLELLLRDIIPLAAQAVTGNPNLPKDRRVT